MFADEKIFKTETQKPGADKSYAFAVRLKPGLIKYRVEFGANSGAKETILNSVTNLVCGDAFLIDGQSNALATDTREDALVRARALAPALAHRDADVTLVHARAGAWTAEPWMAGMRVVEIPRGLRTLYPAWDLLGRPTLRVEAEVVHATNPAGVPPRARGRALVVTVHDLAVERMPEMFPARWRWLYRAGLRAAVRRADAILVPSRATAADLMERTGIEASRVRVTPLAAALPSSSSDDGAVRRSRLALPERYVADTSPRSDSDAIFIPTIYPLSE